MIFFFSFLSFQDSFTLLPKRDMSIQTEGSDDETSTLDSGFDNENVLVETLQSRLYESLKVYFVKKLEMIQSKIYTGIP